MEHIHRAVLREIDHFKIQLKTRNTEEITETKPLAPGETMWEYFHRVSHFDKPGIKQVTPVLVLDQFEEFFTVGKKYDQEDKDNLINELYWLIENQLPPSFKEKILKAKKKENIPSFKTQPEVRLIISLREDYLPDFTVLKKQIVSIDRTMFRIIHLNGKQAREIISMPGGFQDKKLINKILRCFYPEEARENEEITIPDDKLEIEPTFLSLLCYQLFEEHKKQKLKSITTEDQIKILENFYDSVMDETFKDEKDKVKKEELKEFIESKLLTEGGYRTPYYLEANHHLRESIDKLVEGRVIRKFYDGKKEYIEIIHDVLEPIIKEKRNKRLDEIRKQEYREQLERKRKYYKRKARIIYSIAIILVCLTWFAFIQTCKVNEQYRISQIHKLTAEALLELPHDNTKAIRIAEAAYEKGLPNPPPRTCQVLSEIGYSSFKEPFYNTILHYQGTIYTAVFSPDDKRILTAHEDGTTKVWDLKGNLIADLNMHKARILSAVFSPDGNRILTASWDHTVKLWDLGGNILHEYNKHNRGVFSAKFSPDGHLIVTASMDHTAKVFNLEGDVQAQLNHNSAVSSAVFSPDGKKILTASWDKSAKLWDINGDILLNLNKHNGQVYSAVFSTDGSRILTASEDGTAKIWDPKGNLILDLNEHKGDVFSAVFSPDGNRILTASDDGTAKVWDLSGNLLANLNKHKLGVKSAFFSSDANWIITASKDGTVKLWDFRSNILADLNKHRAQVNTAVFSPNGRLILTASMDRTVKLWNLEGQLLSELIHKEAVLSAEFSPDGRHILTASGDYAKVWMIEVETQKTSFKFELEHSAVSTAVFSPDGSRILTASENGIVKLWNREGKFQAALDKDERLVSSAVFSPDGNWILTTSRDARR
jgi:WD40 repeat protein